MEKNDYHDFDESEGEYFSSESDEEDMTTYRKARGRPPIIIIWPKWIRFPPLHSKPLVSK
jgi:hypothetical protein